MDDDFNIMGNFVDNITDKITDNITDNISGGNENITGGVTVYQNDHSEPIPKDNVVSQLLPNTISECAIYLNKSTGAPCSTDETINSIAQNLGVSGSKKQIVDQAKEKLNCGDEKCVLSKMKGVLGEAKVNAEIKLRMKVKGPTDNSLLSNINIDSILKQWGFYFPDFFPYNFNMLNYASYSFDNGYILNKPDTLATILFSDLYYGDNPLKKMFRCSACVINSDTYQGEGKHWMALFADARDNKRWTIEFFNSSGNAPAPEWVSWLIKTKNAMELIKDQQKLNVEIDIIKVTDIRHQQSRTECGLYSLFYIWSRLNKVPPEYFLKNPVPDQLMFEFRHHLFDDPKRKPLQEFNWKEYIRSTPVEWE